MRSLPSRLRRVLHVLRGCKQLHKDATILIREGGVKMNSKVYLGVLQNIVLPWIRANYPQESYVWRQERAPSEKKPRDAELGLRENGAVLAVVNVVPFLA